MLQQYQMIGEIVFRLHAKLQQYQMIGEIVFRLHAKLC